MNFSVSLLKNSYEMANKHYNNSTDTYNLHFKTTKLIGFSLSTYWRVRITINQGTLF